ncbi:MAE_28990/MAE_18760 family HEPN-like nuclease [Spirulina sp. CS-785/01]|uniref:MAE_28990/MAE_18760 family HEPN-like nuclease n=1 Tax=Spirulina sp. CS-785/01 TaxID=3021716 RepID=UPI00232EDF3B|nr:MAE_28990/MAE_18760 family HEPN-like nuclease [Spirulina sp. CS-785/01]MDB9314990.1 MAE_28990/MAE_18760 family HEPN-like nuclease [Spirulina sp. CS-785/01]
MSNWVKQLEDDLDWRIAELGILKTQAISAPKGSERYKVMLRALWAMLYAHYEGFCKFAWDLYLDEIQKSQIKRKNCQEQIAKFSLQQQLKNFKQDLSVDNIWLFVTSDFNQLLEDNIDFAVKLETRSNLYPNRFKENIQYAGIHCTLIDTYTTEIKTLVARRNEIAHGQKMPIKDIQEYQKHEDAAIEVMHELALAVVDCLEQKLYLKSP